MISRETSRAFWPLNLKRELDSLTVAAGRTQQTAVYEKEEKRTNPENRPWRICCAWVRRCSEVAWGPAPIGTRNKKDAARQESLSSVTRYLCVW
jgi:hypothetical protein